MPIPQESEFKRPNFLDDPKLMEKFKVELQDIEAERADLHEELAECERLTEADFAVRINARD